MTTISVYKNDLPNGLNFGDSVAVDTEAMGLNNARDRLCVVQLSSGDGNAHLVQIERGQKDAPRLKALLEDAKCTKLFHFARFDIAILKAYLNIDCAPVYCTRTASRIARTYSDKHGLQAISRELLGIEVNKRQQSSDWGTDELTENQKVYAAGDVLHLHALRDKLDLMLKREGRDHLAKACFEFLPARAALDLAGWDEEDIFAHA